MAIDVATSEKLGDSGKVSKVRMVIKNGKTDVIATKCNRKRNKLKVNHIIYGVRNDYCSCTYVYVKYIYKKYTGDAHVLSIRIIIYF